MKTTRQVGGIWIQDMFRVLGPGYVTTSCIDWDLLSMLAGAISNTQFLGLLPVNFAPNPGKQRWPPLAAMVHEK